MLAECQRLPIRIVSTHQLDSGHTFGQFQRGLERVRESPSDVLALHQTIDHNLDVVLFVTGQFATLSQKLGDVDNFSIDAGTNETLTGQIAEQRVVLSLSTAHDRRENLEAGALR